MKTFESISAKLKKRGIDFEVVSFTDTAVSARTVDTSSDHNYDPESAIKTLIISTRDGYQGVILKGSDRIDQPKLKAVVGEWKIVDSETLQKEHEYSPGTICPLELVLPIIIDKTALDLKVWSMGAGSNRKGINVETDEVLRNLHNYKIETIRQEN